MSVKNDKSFWNNIKYWLEKIELRVGHRDALETGKHNKSKRPIVVNNKCCPGFIMQYATYTTLAYMKQKQVALFIYCDKHIRKL